MLDNSSLDECFSSLNSDLYIIEHHPQKPLANPQYSIDEIVHKGFYSQDLDDAREYVKMHLDRIEELEKTIQGKINNLIIKDKRSFYESLVDNVPLINPEDVKNELQINILSHLSFYKENLSKFLSEIVTKINSKNKGKSGTAGFKLRLNLTNEQIANLFISMYETGLIDNKKIDGSKLMQKELALFISKNFASKTRDNISIEGIENSLIPSRRTVLPSIKNELKKIETASS